MFRLHAVHQERHNARLFPRRAISLTADARPFHHALRRFLLCLRMRPARCCAGNPPPPGPPRPRCCRCPLQTSRAFVKRVYKGALSIIRRPGMAASLTTFFGQHADTRWAVHFVPRQHVKSASIALTSTGRCGGLAVHRRQSAVAVRGGAHQPHGVDSASTFDTCVNAAMRAGVNSHQTQPDPRRRC